MNSWDHDWREERGISTGAGFASPKPYGMEETSFLPDGRRSLGSEPGWGPIRKHRRAISPWRPIDEHRRNSGFTDRRLFGIDDERRAIQMVPTGGYRKVRLFLGRRFTPQAEDKGVVGIRPLGRNDYALDGLRPGRTLIHAVNRSDVCESELRIYVTGEMRIPLAFRHYVYYKDGKRLRDSSWSEGQVKGLLREVNDIYVPQTNVCFHRLPAPWEARAGVDFGNSLDVERKEVIEDAAKQIVGRAAFTVLLVGGLTSSDFTSRTGGVGTMDKPNLVFVAYTSRREEAAVRIAHELGHHLTGSLYLYAGGHNPDRRYLMYESVDNGCRIDFTEAKAMREWILDYIPREESPEQTWWMPLSL